MIAVCHFFFKQALKCGQPWCRVSGDLGSAFFAALTFTLPSFIRWNQLGSLQVIVELIDCACDVWLSRKAIGLGFIVCHSRPQDASEADSNIYSIIVSIFEIKPCPALKT